jgi:N-acylneuraminate cytidylyltransferase
MSGEVILPLVLDPRYSVDIDNLCDWERAEWVLRTNGLEAVWPGARPRPLPESVDLVVLDFDGVMTDDRVWVDGEGREAVAAHRGDGWGLARLRERGVQVVVLSTERNPVVTARCQKLGLPVVQGVEDKAAALTALLAERRLDPSHTLYLGNDVNDLACFPVVGCALAVADAHPEVKARADLILSRPGGQGAVRELCDLLMRRMKEAEEHA